MKNLTFVIIAIAVVLSACTKQEEEEPKVPRTVVITQGALPGVFSVGASSTVRFSAGNLQYCPATAVWRFAPQQYEVIGYRNSNLSSTYGEWIDLYGWGTSGYHDANDVANINYLPISFSSVRDGQGDRTVNHYGYGPSTNMSDNNLEGASRQYDWGVHNAIADAGGAGTWRTLSADEWNYLLFYRNGVHLADSMHARFFYATVCNVHGLMLIPDRYAHPESVPFPKGINQTSDFSINNYNTKQWYQLEAAGVVFLPTGGQRDGRIPRNVSVSGCYWTTTHYDAIYAYSVSFTAESIFANRLSNRNSGLNVRLVK